MSSLTQNTDTHITVLYHSKDPDGWTSGAILRKKHPTCTLIGYDYGEPIPDIPSHTTCIIVVDVCLTPQEMRHLATIGKDGLIYIDHHQTSIDKITNDINDNGEYNITCIFGEENNNLSACELTWEYCFPETTTPIYVHLIGSADANRYPERYPEHSRTYMLLGLEKVYNFCSPETCPSWVLEKEEDTISMTYIMQKEEENTLKEFALSHAFEKKLSGFNAICLETTIFHPKAFASVFDPSIHDIMVAFQKRKNDYKVSIYYIGTDPKISAASIAMNFGGGGHSYAAGFQTEDIYSIFDN